MTAEARWPCVTRRRRTLDLVQLGSLRGGRVGERPLSNGQRAFLLLLIEIGRG